MVRARINYLAIRVDELEAACNLATQVIQQKDTEIAGLQAGGLPAARGDSRTKGGGN